MVHPVKYPNTMIPYTSFIDVDLSQDSVKYTFKLYIT